MHIDQYERTWIIVTSITLGVFMAALVAGAVIFGVRVPEPAGFVNPQQLEDTQFANPGVRDMGDGKYEVVMIAQMWFFLPNTIEVPVGSEVEFIITSSDVTHGFIIQEMNANFEIVPGHVSRQRVTFDEVGEYRIVCHEYCGRGHQNMFGTIIVTEDTTDTAALGE